MITKRAMSQFWTQDFVKVGAECWVLHLSNGNKPVAEGIAGDTPPLVHTGESIGRNILRQLCESDQQMLKVTNIIKKNTELMYPDDTTFSMYLDDYISPPAPSFTRVTWSTRYLVEKDDHM